MHLTVSLNIASMAGQTSALTFRDVAGFVRQAEAAGLDMIILEDSAPDAPASSSPFEATTLLAALATVTTRIGLVAAASTVAHQPYNLARRFASLDIISHGRAGWHATMAQASREAANFSRPDGFSNDDFRRRTEEYIGIVRGLWQGWDADALLFDKGGGRFHDPDKMHLLDHKGEFFSVRGPLNVARSPQDQPVLVLSVLSEADMDIAARTADVILLDGSAEDAKARHDDLKRRVAVCGREPDSVKVLLNVGVDTDVDRLDTSFRSEDCDGFNITMPPPALDDFVGRVLPEVRRRGLLRDGYRGTTLRSHLGLAGGGDQ
ncbi:LLM class flavin-dependent oxidoreductase [Mesorhizobium opportunistum]|uniref:LLM class flavin-dependent oxidoreductase n=1 Tax=Mesorhizobium opportunistum TaxID=593909 RepID=A0ABV1YHC3_9HYPH|nr:LLM class flavin-dependent oxidoreductase [Mesorhizobium sp.]TIN97181.1 MAG: LLM class flavin-dependent oxidoreductase [Mesorhizobium sp.]TJV00128.1 MAG: LLM class flavin-dependent oxidoreductase [Mesorhizobium sp.]TJV17050.1 MAG: LLM class flavin-dependent oxidoreductase [Mesorhizobium sp.]